MTANDDGETPAETPAEPKKVSFTRIAIWVGAGAVGLYMVISGVIGIVSGGS